MKKNKTKKRNRNVLLNQKDEITPLRPLSHGAGEARAYARARAN